MKQTDVGEGPNNNPAYEPYGLPENPSNSYLSFMPGAGGPTPDVPRIVSHEKYTYNPRSDTYDAIPASPYMDHAYPYF